MCRCSSFIIYILFLFVIVVAVHAASIEEEQSELFSLMVRNEVPISVGTYYFISTLTSYFNHLLSAYQAYKEIYHAFSSLACIIIINLIGYGFPLYSYFRSRFGINIPAAVVNFPTGTSLNYFYLMAFAQYYGNMASDLFRKSHSSTSSVIGPAADLFYLIYSFATDLSAISVTEIFVLFFSTVIFIKEYFLDQSYTIDDYICILVYALTEAIYKISLRHFRLINGLSFLDGLHFICISDLLSRLFRFRSTFSKFSIKPEHTKSPRTFLLVIFYFFYSATWLYLRKVAMLWFDRIATPFVVSYIMFHRELPYKVIRCLLHQDESESKVIVLLNVLNSFLLIADRIYGKSRETDFSAFEIRCLRRFAPLLPPSLYDEDEVKALQDQENSAKMVQSPSLKHTAVSSSSSVFYVSITTIVSMCSVAILALF